MGGAVPLLVRRDYLSDPLPCFAKVHSFHLSAQAQLPSCLGKNEPLVSPARGGPLASP